MRRHISIHVRTYVPGLLQVLQVAKGGLSAEFYTLEISTLAKVHRRKVMFNISRKLGFGLLRPATASALALLPGARVAVKVRLKNTLSKGKTFAGD